VAETVRKFYLCMAACPIAFAITVAATVILHWQAANVSSKEVSMDTKHVHREMVRTSVTEVIRQAGTATIGGLLAA